jgi:ComF family protein
MRRNNGTEYLLHSSCSPGTVRAIVGRIAGWVIPTHCILCQEGNCYPPISSPICARCEKDLPAQGQSCKICAISITVPGICGACLAAPPNFDRTIALWRYAPPVDKLVQTFKFNAALYLAPWFAEKLLRVTHWSQVTNDDFGHPLLLPMPLHRSRLRERGFNQTHEIARFIGRGIHAHAPSNAVIRQRARPPQTEMPLRDRSANVQGVFSCNVNLTGQSIVVLDDVMTTGATLNELARVLKLAGAKNVTNWVLARTPPPR